MIPEKCDIAVIGGGPSGSTVATLLSKKGYDVVLLEKQLHPRATVGESLLPHVWRFLDILEISDVIKDEGFIAKQGGTVVWDDKIYQVSFSDFGYTRPGLHVERDRFDYLLLENAKKAGARVYEKVAVTEAILNGDNGSALRYRILGTGETGKISCRYIIDASGQNALISRQLNMREIDEDYRFVALWGYFEGGKYIARDGKAYEMSKLREIPPTTFIASTGDWGWSWHIPMRKSTSVSMVLKVDKFMEIKRNYSSLEDYFKENISNAPYFSSLLSGARYIEGSFQSIRDYSYKPKQLTGPGYYLLGDAAAFVDPIFSLGVTIGMYSGNIAAWAIDRSLRNPHLDESSRNIYSNQFRGYYELARSMAIPGKSVPEKSQKLASRFLKFQSETERDLLYLATLLTSRDHNFDSVVSQYNNHEKVMEKCDVLESIEF